MGTGVRQANKRTGRWTERRANGRNSGRTDGEMDRRVDGQTDGQMDRRYRRPWHLLGPVHSHAAEIHGHLSGNKHCDCVEPKVLCGSKSGGEYYDTESRTCQMCAVGMYQEAWPPVTSKDVGKVVSVAAHTNCLLQSICQPQNDFASSLFGFHLCSQTRNTIFRFAFEATTWKSTADCDPSYGMVRCTTIAQGKFIALTRSGRARCILRMARSSKTLNGTRKIHTMVLSPIRLHAARVAVIEVATKTAPVRQDARPAQTGRTVRYVFI